MINFAYADKVYSSGIVNAFFFFFVLNVCYRYKKKSITVSSIHKDKTGYLSRTTCNLTNLFGAQFNSAEKQNIQL